MALTAFFIRSLLCCYFSASVFRLVAMYCFKNSYICSSVGGQPFRLHANPEVQLPTPSAPLFPRYPCPMQIFSWSSGSSPSLQPVERRDQIAVAGTAGLNFLYGILQFHDLPFFRNHSFSPISPIWRIESRVRSALPTPNSSAILTYGTSSGL